MNLELDHLLVFTEQGAPVVDRLVAAGFREGTPNQHPGQGTANRRVFFADAYLEFVFPTDRAVLASRLVAPTGMLARFEGGCPLGVALRGPAREKETPFPVWAYRPPYLPDGTSILIATSCALPEEPLIAIVPFGQRPDLAPAHQAQPLNHPVKPQSTRTLHLTGPWQSPRSQAMAALATMPGISVDFGAQYHAQVSLHPTLGDQVLDLRPDAPVSLSW